MGRINIPQSLSLRPPRDAESDGRAADGVSQNSPQVFYKGRGVDPLPLILYELIFAYTRGLRWNHFILHLCHYGQLWINLEGDVHQEGAEAEKSVT